MRLQTIIENISFANLNLPLSVVDELFEDKRYTEIEKLKLFSTIVDEIDLSNNITELICLIVFFSEEYDYSGFNRYDRLRYNIFNNKYNGDNHIVAFMYLYKAIIKAGNVRRLPDLLKAFEGFNYRLTQYTAFGFMISMMDAEEITQHRALIENVLEKLLNNWYQLPEDLGKKYIKKKGLFSDLVRGIEGTDILEHKAPYFTKLLDLISNEEHSIMYRKSGTFELLSLIGLKEGQPLTESQWSRLLFVFETMIDNFYKIQTDKEFIHLFYAASSFVEILLQKKPELIKQTFANKIWLFTANLEAIKNNFPKEWNDYSGFFSVSKLHDALYSNTIKDVINLLNTKEFEEFIKQIYIDLTKNLDIIKNIILAIQDSEFLSSINFGKIEDEVNEYELELLQKFTIIIKNWKNKDFTIPDIDFLEDIRNEKLNWKITKPYYLEHLSGQEKLAGVCEGVTEKALLIRFKGGDDISFLIPKSTIHSSYNSKITTSQMFEIDAWIVKNLRLP